jgi:hypothetical protein
MQDFLGYQRAVAGQHILSSEYAALLMAGTTTSTASRLGLVQGLQCSYSHQVAPVFEAGSSNLYWLTGQPVGGVSVSRVVGDNLVSGLQGLAQPGSSGQLLNQGAIGEVDFKVGATSLNQTVIRFGGCVLTSVGWGTSVGSLTITTSLNMSVAILYPVNLTGGSSIVGTLSSAALTGGLAAAVGSVAGTLAGALTGSSAAASVVSGVVQDAGLAALGL